jgi:hypothetical protein
MHDRGSPVGDGVRESPEEPTITNRSETAWEPAVSGNSPGGRPIRHLLIISRYHPGLYEYVRARFAGEDNVEVILDRRRGRDRRSTPAHVPAERRATDRRVRPHVDDALRMESMQFVTISRGAPRAHPRGVVGGAGCASSDRSG